MSNIQYLEKIIYPSREISLLIKFKQYYNIYATYVSLFLVFSIIKYV